MLSVRAAVFLSLTACGSPSPPIAAPASVPSPPSATATPATPPAPSAPPSVEVRLRHVEGDTWSVDYTFSSPLSVVTFTHPRLSRDAWRLGAPTDAKLVGSSVGAPLPFTHLSFTVTTSTVQPEKEYAPFLR